jgi:hypothetical protein
MGLPGFTTGKPLLRFLRADTKIIDLQDNPIKEKISEINVVI